MSYSEAFEDAHFLRHPVQLQVDAEKRRRAFRASIAERATIAANPQRALAAPVPKEPEIVRPKAEPARRRWRATCKYPPIPVIIDAVAAHYAVSSLDIISARRTANVVLPRHVAIYLSKILTPKSLPQIGMAFNGRDHTSCLYAIDKLAGFVANHIEVSARMEVIKQDIFQPSRESFDALVKAAVAALAFAEGEREWRGDEDDQCERPARPLIEALVAALKTVGALPASHLVPVISPAPVDAGEAG